MVSCWYLWTTVVGSLMLSLEAQSFSCRLPSGGTGVCGSVKNCSQLNELVERARIFKSAPIIAQLRSYLCPSRGPELLMCCPQNSFSLQQPSTNDLSRGGISGGSSLLPSKCGTTSLTDRIVDGQNAPLNAWPWMVILKGFGSSWFCGGVLISALYVLSAAHCFKPSNGVLLELVRVGEHTFSTNPDCEFGVCKALPQDLRVEQVLVHPQYGKGCSQCNDIALLRLATPARIDSVNVVPICLPLNPLQDMGFSMDNLKGKVAWAAGWGTTSTKPSQVMIPEVLQQVQLPIKDLAFCHRLRSSYPDPHMVLCAGGEGRDTCRGDSGGPLVLSNNFDTRRFVVGITSLGPKACGASDTQGIYTSVHHYIQWILANLRP